jgi:hypothetical protein
MWPFRRRSPHPPSARAAASAEVPERGWASLPSLQRAGAPMSTTVAVQAFRDGLASWRRPHPFLAPLGHTVSPEGPSGLVSGIAAPVPDATPAATEGTVATWSRPVVTGGPPVVVSRSPEPAATDAPAPPPLLTSAPAVHMPSVRLPDAGNETRAPEPVAAPVAGPEIVVEEHAAPLLGSEQAGTPEGGQPETTTPAAPRWTDRPGDEAQPGPMTGAAAGTVQRSVAEPVTGQRSAPAPPVSPQRTAPARPVPPQASGSPVDTGRASSAPVVIEQPAPSPVREAARNEPTPAVQRVPDGPKGLEDEAPTVAGLGPTIAPPVQLQAGGTAAAGPPGPPRQRRPDGLPAPGGAPVRKPGLGPPIKAPPTLQRRQAPPAPGTVGMVPPAPAPSSAGGPPVRQAPAPIPPPQDGPSHVRRAAAPPPGPQAAPPPAPPASASLLGPRSVPSWADPPPASPGDAAPPRIPSAPPAPRSAVQRAKDPPAPPAAKAARPVPGGYAPAPGPAAPLLSVLSPVAFEPPATGSPAQADPSPEPPAVRPSLGPEAAPPAFPSIQRRTVQGTAPSGGGPESVVRTTHHPAAREAPAPRAATLSRWASPGDVALAVGAARLAPDGSFVFHPPAPEPTAFPRPSGPAFASPAPPAVQRAVDPPPAEPPAPPPSPDAATPAPASPPPAPGAPGAPTAAAAPGANLDDLARRLYPKLRPYLRKELWLDRERAGVLTDPGW